MDISVSKHPALTRTSHNSHKILRVSLNLNWLCDIIDYRGALW